MMYSGVNFLALDTLASEVDALKKQFMSLWTFDPKYLEVISDMLCTQIDASSGFWNQENCHSLAVVSCFDTRIQSWTLTKSPTTVQGAPQACAEILAEFRPIQTPDDNWELITLLKGKTAWINNKFLRF